ncbi:MULTISPECIES: glycosyltransferase family 2 protein [Paenibacillus]|uniref:Glycosyltransferase family 2 protein n=2 Tax=Paenibacillus TaxID=44249 RepID=A0ABU6D9A3_9BACL|nr:MULTISPECIES: glycosyltransferase family 2 protein [Paenibacillus]MBA2938559.1 glycosyltransferase family 2 protein [Paenibacillus sp. CGMCC 1.16610]MCY9656671.1 glycosyltransferase family 2 protein [Paenibacillus anseongense]MEB4794320.1 glycosyltransferase family 2 protein [Paenibacillus chondroitinus]MVQ38752.1 glycosyltransferase [Paenibacillus anseongense]
MSRYRDAVGVNRISVVIIAQDDESRIANAIASCKPFADEIVVVDGGSKDGTVRVSEQLGCKVYVNAWPGYAKQRIYGSDRATYDWIFVIDTDEVVNEQLSTSIQMLKGELSDPSKAYSVLRIGDFLGRWMGKGEKLVRLYNRTQIQYKESLVHETPNVENENVLFIPGVLWHYGFRSIHDHIQRFNKYTDLEAEGAVAMGKRFSLLRMLVRPPLRFVQKYIVHGLYKKGIPGLAVALFWGIYEFLVCMKQYELGLARKRVKKSHDGPIKEGKAYATIQ